MGIKAEDGSCMKTGAGFLIFLAAACLAFSAGAQETTPTAAPTFTPTVTRTATPVPLCRNRKIIDLQKFGEGGILYKSDNEHGGRGATLIIQNFKYWYGGKQKKIYDSNCNKLIGAFGWWNLGFPYGERYYSRYIRGSWDSGASLALKAYRATRKRGGIVIISRRYAVRVKDFRYRDGFVRS